MAKAALTKSQKIFKTKSKEIINYCHSEASNTKEFSKCMKREMCGVFHGASGKAFNSCLTMTPAQKAARAKAKAKAARNAKKRGRSKR